MAKPSVFGGKVLRSVKEIAEHLREIKSALARNPPRILVFGDLMLDEYIHGDVARLSPEAPIPVVRGSSTTIHAGGSANVAVNLAALGAEASVIGIVGQDATARDLQALLAASNISTDGIVSATDRPTTRKTRIVGATQQIVRIDYEDTHPITSQTTQALRTLIDSSIAQYDAVILSDYNKGLCTPEITQHLIAMAQRHDVPVICDPKGTDFSKYAGVSLITPNRKEASKISLSQIETAQDALALAQNMRANLGISACAITLGPDGIALSADNLEIHEPTFATEVADVTGAGDSVIAAYAIGFAIDQSLEISTIFANAVASVTVRKLGCVAVSFEDLADQFAMHNHDRALGTSSPEAQLKQIETLKSEGRSIVFTNGCFDLLHAGHIDYLEQAADLGDILVVGVNDDASVERLKGAMRPLNPLDLRLRQLQGLAAVDFVIPFKEDTPCRLIETVLPDILVKGTDYTKTEIVGWDIVEENGGRVERIAFKYDISTTKLIAKIQDQTS